MRLQIRKVFGPGGEALVQTVGVVGDCDEVFVLRHVENGGAEAGAVDVVGRDGEADVGVV